MVDVRSALHPTALFAASLAPLYVVRQQALGVVFGAFGVGRGVVLRGGSPASGVVQAGGEEGGAECELLPSPLLRPSPPVPTCSTLAHQLPAVAVAVCFEEK